MPTIIDQRSSLDQTVKIYDSFYATNLIVNAADFDIVFGYFKNVCVTNRIAGNFTAVLFRIAQETGVNILDLLDILKGTDSKLQMNKLITYYLNGFKSKTTLYGVGVIPRPNQPVARNVVQ